MARIAFVQSLAFEYLGVMYLSSILKQNGHTVEMFLPKGSPDKLVEEVVNFKPQLVGFSCTTGAHAWSLKFAEELKKKIQAKTIFGGAHPTFFPEIINEPAVDIVCRGEGEYALLEIADKLDNNQIYTDTLSCWFKIAGKIIRNGQRPLIDNLDKLPFPDRELYISKYPYLAKSQKVFIGGRGCPFQCTYCFNHALIKLYKGKGKFVRYRGVDNLIKEIQEVRDRYGLKTVYMQDDTLIINKSWVTEFADKYRKEINLPFICLIRADLVDEKVIKQLSRANCKRVFFGIETGSDDLRNLLLKKKITDEEIIKTATLLKKYRLKFRTYNMLGLPGETIEDAFKTVSLNTRLKTDYPWCSLFYPFPGTELATYAEKHGLIDCSANQANPSFFKDSVIKSEHKHEFVNLQKLFFYAVKFPRLTHIIKKLISFKPNIIFEIAFLISYAWCYIRSENIGFTEAIQIGSRNVGRFFFGKD